ncbi:DUF2093 domain-containing protein [Pelagibacteraceae bacterium]|nr:DUF2093 domain-containing protein [Pelagibacteraceae bacterium]
MQYSYKKILYILFLEMNKIKAKLLYKANSFDVLQEGDYVICAVSKKEIPLSKLNYWNVDLQEAYFSPAEVQIRFESIKLSKD